MTKKKIVFLTGTRADFGKIKALINKLEKSQQYEPHIFVTGMHMLSKYGSTYTEVRRQHYKNIYEFINQTESTTPDIVLSNTLLGFSNYVNELKPDLIVVHGDRIESLAAAMAGVFNNIRVAHIEGGEVSGTIDESIRHAISKFSHLHFVSNQESKSRLIQLGEKKERIHVIGSPDIEIMKSKNLPKIHEAKKHYDLTFKKYAMFIYHPVTTDIENLSKNIAEVVSALIESTKNYIVILSNNDKGSDIILNEFNRFKGNDHFRIFPSIRFEYFLTLLKHSEFIIGNSSAGIREAEVYGIPSIDIGSRQNNRTPNKDVIKVSHDKSRILQIIQIAINKKLSPKSYFGRGNSSTKFIRILSKLNLKKISLQKEFCDIINHRTK